MDKISVLIADDHELVRKGLRHFLETDKHLQVTEAKDGQEAYARLAGEPFDLAILDVQMPCMTGLDVAEKLTKDKNPVNLILLTMFKDESVFNKAMDAGVRGFILKENTVEEIMACIRKVMSGGYFVSQTLTEFMINRNVERKVEEGQFQALSQLTSAESKILKLLATMKTNQEIAADLNLSIKTVHNHRNNICSKLGLRGAHALLKFAIDNASRY